MQPMKKEAIRAITNLPDNVDMEGIMYRLYVLDKIQKGKEDIRQGRTIAHKDLKHEIDKW